MYPDQNCPLCKLVHSTRSSDSLRTTFFYNDSDFIITDCPICGQPIAVYKHHLPSVSVEISGRIQATLTTLFGNGRLDKSACVVAKGHCHVHFIEEARGEKKIGTVTVTNSSPLLLPRSIAVDGFTPYELDDLGVIVPHCSFHPSRWEWFWPNYVAVTPSAVLKNTIVVYHSRGEEGLNIPPLVQSVEQTSTLAVIERMGESIAWSTQLGLDRCKSRLIARVANDVRFAGPGWAQNVLSEFNKEPHFKILAKVVASPDGGPSYERLKKVCYAPWMHRLLRHGDYDRLPFICGQMIIMNRPLWLGYYSLVSDYTLFEREDIYLSLFARADGVPVVDYTSQFHHFGRRGEDGVYEGNAT